MALQQGGEGDRRPGWIAAALPGQGQAEPDRGHVMGRGQRRQSFLGLARRGIQAFECEVERDARIAGPGAPRVEQRSPSAPPPCAQAETAPAMSLMAEKKAAAF